MELRRRLRVRAFFSLATAASLFAAAFGVLMAPVAHAQTVPYEFNLQGKLTDASGNELTNGSYNIKFRLYSAASGGTNLWEADRVYGASDHRISVQNGLFSVQLGDTSQGDPTLSPSLFNTQTNAALYLEVELPSPATATCASNGCATWTEGPMTPRQLLVSAPYALNADNLDGLSSTAFGQLATTNSFAQTNTFSAATGVVLSGTPASGGSLLQVGSALSSGSASGTLISSNGTFSGDLMNLQVANNTELKVDNSGNLTLAGSLTIGATTVLSSGGVLQNAAFSGTYSNAVTLSSASNTFTGNGASLTSLNPTNLSQGSGAVTLQSAASTALAITGNAASTWSTSSGALTLQGASGVTVDTGSAAGISVGTTFANAITLGRFGVTTSTAGGVSVNSGTNVPTATQVQISNASSTGVTTANANGLSINYKGGAAAVAASGLRVDFAPGSTSGGTWSGLNIVANATGPAAGITEYGMELTGPTTDGAGQETAVEIASGWDLGIDIQSGGLQLATQSDPAVPATGNLKVYASMSANRAMLEVESSSGRSYPLQPSLFSNNVVMINASGGATAPNVFGTSLTSAGSQTISHPTATAAYGYMTNFASSATATFEAGTSMNPLVFMRGSSSGDAGGFFFMDRLAFPDANYSESSGTTGSRTFVGLSDQTLSTAVSSDNPAGNRAGFSFVSNGAGRIDTNWMFSAKDGTTEDLVNTGMAFTAGDSYDVYIFCPTQCTTIYWEIDNMTPGVHTVQTGSVTANLPGATTAMRGIEALIDLDTTHVVRNLRSQRMYVESDR